MSTVIGEEPSEPLQPIAALGLDNGILGSVAWSCDGQRIAVPTQESAIDVWDVATKTRVCKLTGAAGPAYGIAFHPLGGHLVSVSRGGALFLWNLTDGALRDKVS